MAIQRIFLTNAELIQVTKFSQTRKSIAEKKTHLVGEIFKMAKNIFVGWVGILDETHSNESEY